MGASFKVKLDSFPHHICLFGNDFLILNSSSAMELTDSIIERSNLVSVDDVQMLLDTHHVKTLLLEVPSLGGQVWPNLACLS